MGKHTPGPWYVDTEYPIQIVKHMEHLVGTSKCAEYVVADISEGAFMGEEELANARLIAAAPEMLALLDQAHSALQMAIASKTMGRFQDAVFADIGALLSRIEGETK